MSRSQATLYQYALKLISIQPEVTFVRLRYSLGGDRPSQTAHQTRSPGLSRVRAKDREEWYFNVGSPEPESPGSQPPTYPTQAKPRCNAKLQ